MIKMQKYTGNIAITIIIFIFAFIFFSICAIDAGYVITSRYKSQKITETIALYMISVLNSKPEAERTTESLDNIKERFQNIYSNMDSYYNFEISDIEIKNIDTNPKIKIMTTTYTPTLFLKYTGIGLIKVLQTSYAKSEEYEMPLFKSDKNSYTFKTSDIITDKTGDDVRVIFDSDYFIFAGIEDDENNIYWTEIGSMTESSKTKYEISNNEQSYETYCINKGDATFDFSSNPSKTIGLAKYIKIYKTECKETMPPDAETPDTEEETETINPPVVTILNSVKLINKDRF